MADGMMQSGGCSRGKRGGGGKRGLYHVDLAVVGDQQSLGWLEGEYQDVQLE